MNVVNIGLKTFDDAGLDWDAFVSLKHENGNTEDIRLTELIERIVERKIKEKQE
jgi:hypothetical protein